MHTAIKNNLYKRKHYFKSISIYLFEIKNKNYPLNIKNNKFSYQNKMLSYSHMYVIYYTDYYLLNIRTSIHYNHIHLSFYGET